MPNSATTCICGGAHCVCGCYIPEAAPEAVIRAPPKAAAPEEPEAALTSPPDAAEGSTLEPAAAIKPLARTGFSHRYDVQRGELADIDSEAQLASLIEMEAALVRSKKKWTPPTPDDLGDEELEVSHGPRSSRGAPRPACAALILSDAAALFPLG